MMFEQIDRIKQQYTDKYVVVDDRRPELARFKGVVGQVKTVNMSGRALVEFMEFHKNVAWFDIDIDYLKVIDKPAPAVKVAKEQSKPVAKKPVAAKSGQGAKKLSPLEMARMQGAAKKKGSPPAAAASPSSANTTLDTGGTSSKQPVATQKGGGKRSVADILAAARGEKASAVSKEAEKPLPTASAKPPAEAEPDKKMSVAEILAAARAGKEVAAADASSSASARAEITAPQPPSVATTTVPNEPATDAAEPKSLPQPSESADSGQSSPPPAATAGGGKVDRASMSVTDMIAWCREHDG